MKQRIFIAAISLVVMMVVSASTTIAIEDHRWIKPDFGEMRQTAIGSRGRKKDHALYGITGDTKLSAIGY